MDADEDHQHDSGSVSGSSFTEDSYETLMAQAAARREVLMGLSRPKPLGAAPSAFRRSLALAAGGGGNAEDAAPRMEVPSDSLGPADMAEAAATLPEDLLEPILGGKGASPRTQLYPAKPVARFGGIQLRQRGVTLDPMDCPL